MDTQPLFPHRNPEGSSDPLLDSMLERALGQRAMIAEKIANLPHGGDRVFKVSNDNLLTREQAAELVGSTSTAIARARVIREWAKCLGVVLCAVLGTLLLGRVLENLRTTPQALPPALSAPTPAPVQPAKPLESSHVARAPFQSPPAPRAQPVLPSVGQHFALRMPDNGGIVGATFRGYLVNAAQLPLHGGQLGDTYIIGPHMWILSIPAGINRMSWVDP